MPAHQQALVALETSTGVVFAALAGLAVIQPNAKAKARTSEQSHGQVLDRGLTR
jgi:hypothetical protein